ncbi:MAG: N-acetylmuramoyl-L-alanine amidase [Clostridium sp.]|nr:N-acetylmuramoyl-L-alanine amidase [Clostridium sp.]
MSNSSLVSYTRISPHKYSPRDHAIDTITIHCMAGNLSLQTCGQIFQTRQASSNYGIDSAGQIALYVDESDGSWCSSSRSNDMRAVTIEVANDGGAETGWHVSDAALQSLIRLCADICRRNGIDRLRWEGNPALIGQTNRQNMTVHRWFSNKACPGDYLFRRHPYIADSVNRLLNDNPAKAPAQEAKKKGDFYSMTEQQRTAFIHNLYVTYTGRVADPAGITYWLSQITEATSLVTLERRFAAQAECRNYAIRSAYQNLLHRQPEAAGLESWMVYLQSHTVADMYQAIMSTAEYRKLRK